MSTVHWGCDEWVERLADRFFSPASAQEPVVFAVDRSVLADMTGLSMEQAEAALCEVVRQQVMPGHAYAAVRSQCERWYELGGHGPPPSLPLLAVTVLAAAGMSTTNYYKPLRRLLDPGDDGAGIPPTFDQHVPWMWEQLRWWLDEHLDGARGIATLQVPGHFTNIGYSLQQAALRESDKPLLYRFFRAIGLRPEDEQVVGGELRRALAAWSAGAGSRAQRLRRFATEDSLRELAEPFLESLARSWDGRLTSAASGQRSAPLRVVLELRPLALRWVAPRRAGDPELVSAMWTGGEVELRGDGPWFEPLIPLEPDADQLSVGLELRAGADAYFHEPQLAIPFRYDDDLYDFASVDRIQFGEKHHVLVRSNLRTELEAWLKVEGLRAAISPKATPDLPTGWLLYKDLVLHAEPSHEPPQPIRDLLGSSGGGHRLRLLGGLKLPRFPRTYLSGGAPDVALPPGLEGGRFTIEADGHPPLAAKPTEGKVMISAFPLAAGEYRLRYEDLALSFQLVDGVAGVPGVDVGSIETVGLDGRSAQGLVATGPSPKPPTSVRAPKAGHLALVIGPSPCDVQFVVAPTWLERLAGPLDWTTVDLWVDFEPVWLLVAPLDGPPKYRASCIGSAPPAPSSAEPSQWSRLIGSSHLDPDATAPQAVLWGRYRRAAGIEVPP